MARPGYVSFYADDRTQKIFDEFVEIKGVTKNAVLSEMMTMYMIAKDEQLYNELLKKSLNIDYVKESIMQADDINEINDYVFMKLGTAYDVNGEPLNGIETIEAYMRRIQQYGETWFSTMSLHTGMAKKKVEYYNKAIKKGETVKILFAIGEGINEVRYSAKIQEIVSNRDETTCPGDSKLIPDEFGADEVAKIWFHITDLQEENNITVDMLKFRTNDNSVKDAISNSQCHFGYVYIG